MTKIRRSLASGKRAKNPAVRQLKAYITQLFKIPRYLSSKLRKSCYDTVLLISNADARQRQRSVSEHLL